MKWSIITAASNLSQKDRHSKNYIKSCCKHCLNTATFQKMVFWHQIQQKLMTTPIHNRNIPYIIIKLISLNFKFKEILPGNKEIFFRKFNSRDYYNLNSLINLIILDFERNFCFALEITKFWLIRLIKVPACLIV